MRKVLLWTITIVGIFAFLIVIGKPNSSKSETVSSGKLSAVQTNHDFGTVSMKDGKVSNVYEIKNSSDKPLTITKLYTSCMCTTAELTSGSQKAGPFGMQGHGGTIPNISIPLQPGEVAKVEAVFDPAAHGSAGVGDIKRSVFVSSQGNPNFELTFSATVRP
jgi:hypothetical protein